MGDQIYAFNESGDYLVFRATPEDLDILAKGKAGNEVLSTPTICGSRIYLRVAFYEGENRKEKLVCFGE